MRVRRQKRADAPGAADIGGIAEILDDHALFVETPVVDEKREITIDLRRRRFVNNQQTIKSARALLARERRDIRPIEIKATVGHFEAIVESRAGHDRFLREADNAVHRVVDAHAIPM